MTESAITIEGLHFSYGKKHVLKGVDLEVPKGSIFVQIAEYESWVTLSVWIIILKIWQYWKTAISCYACNGIRNLLEIVLLKDVPKKTNIICIF